MPRLERRVVVLNRLGFHVRPAKGFAETAQKFRGSVTVTFNGRTVDGKSPLDLLTLAAPKDSAFLLAADGEDAAAALDALEEKFRTRFGVNED